MPNSGSSSDNHPAAALRHYHDAVVLQSASCRENALCHYAFSVECAQKALLCWSTGKSMEEIADASRLVRHGIDDSWKKVQDYLKAQASLNCRLASALSNLTLPAVLYDQHPSRRYQKNFLISEEDLENCKSFSQEMERILMCMIIDGLIQV